MKANLMAALLVLAACVPDGDPLAKRDPVSGNVLADNVAGFLQPVDPGFPRAGNSYATASYLYGIQVEYFAADGSAYLWFRGNKAPLQGQWKIQGKGFNTELCFRYGKNTQDAVTGTRGDVWQCGRLAKESMDVVSVVSGDPFGLTKGKIPQMELRRCTLPEPMKQMTRTMRCL